MTNDGPINTVLMNTPFGGRAVGR